jgi:hypothetical protein
MKTILIILILILIGCGNSKTLISSKENSTENIKNSIGEFKVGIFEDCGTGGVENVTYKYRIGNWTFYYPNGQIKAIGKYKPIQTEISTRCELNEKIEFSVLDNNWNFFDNNGVKTKPTEKMINELTCVTQEDDGELKIQYCFDRENNRVVHNVITE